MAEFTDAFLRDKTVGSLMGVMIGDAMGLPAECQSPTDIRLKFGFIDSMVPNKHHTFKNVASKPSGTISDDSQLTLALMDSLGRGYDLADIKKAHVDAWKEKWGAPVGWGKSTRVATLAIQNNEWKPPTEGAGNGTCMKIAPLSIYSILRCRGTTVGRFTNSFNASLFKKCKEISDITHGDPRCAVATYCQARMVIRAIQHEIPLYPLQIIKLFIQDAEYAESRMNVIWPEDGMLSERLKAVLTTTYSLIPRQDGQPKDSSGNIHVLDLDTATVSSRICICQSSYVMNSYPLVAYCVAKYLPCLNFMKAVTETVNAGADADSNASMVGAIVGGYLGQKLVPSGLFTKIKKSDKLLSEIARFWRALQ